MRWLLTAAGCTWRCRGLGVRAVPGLLGRDHVAEAALARSTRARRTCGRRTRSGASTRDVLGEGHVGRALLNSLIVASADDDHLPDRRRDGRLRARALPRAGHAHRC